MQHELNKTNTNTIMFNIFFISKSTYVKTSDLQLRKMQIHFYFKKNLDLHL